MKLKEWGGREVERDDEMVTAPFNVLKVPVFPSSRSTPQVYIFPS